MSALAVAEAFGSRTNAELRVVDAADGSLTALNGVTDPQEKRRADRPHVHRGLSRRGPVDPRCSISWPRARCIPDVIESGGEPDGPTATIKIHHNVGGLPDELGFELIEPLRDLFKDEVRRLGLELGLPDSLVWRHPFPGPGLAVRCLGEVTAPSGSRSSARPTRSSWRSCRPRGSIVRSPRPSRSCCRSSRSA